jgi:uncharacterized protein YbaR (Trm112 family)
MPEKPSLPVPLDASVLELLACPACQGVLSIYENRLVCTACRRAYPIVDGIPVLIAERAEAPPI